MGSSYRFSKPALCGELIEVLKIGFVTVDEVLGKRAWTSGHYIYIFNEIDLVDFVLENSMRISWDK